MQKIINSWRADELEILEKGYDHYNLDELCELIPSKERSSIERMVELYQTAKESGAERSYIRASWTEEEDEVIRKYYADSVTDDILGMLAGRNKRAINLRAIHLGIKKTEKAMNETYARVNGGSLPWSREEDELIREHYPSKPTKDIVDLFTNRTKASIVKRAGKLGVKKNKDVKGANSGVRKKRKDSWSEEEDQIIKDNVEKLGATGCQKLLTNRSLSAVKTRISALGLTNVFKVYWEATDVSVDNDNIFSVSVSFKRSDKL